MVGIYSYDCSQRIPKNTGYLKQRNSSLCCKGCPGVPQRVWSHVFVALSCRHYEGVEMMLN